MEKEPKPNFESNEVALKKPTSKRKLFFAWILLGVAILYGVSPIDFMPEAILGPFGLGDDIVINVLAIYNLIKQIRNQKTTEIS
jgi:uncharacterized membrane protein YkvA (DUF1232 family)